MDELKIDLKELERMKEKNFEERLKFIELYVKWLKEHKVKVERREE